MYPNLLIIGAMKSGTTSLHDYLKKHPDIFMSDPKEIHYYDNLSTLSKSEYLSHFKSNKKVIGTTPQSYTKAHHPDFKEVASKIYKDTPNVKLIYIVRDPFERVLSHVLEMKYGDSIDRYKQNINIGDHWKTSLYYYQISQYLKYFNKKNIYVLTLENLQKNKLKELNKLFEFLGVRKLDDKGIFDYVKNNSKFKKTPSFIKSKIWYRLLLKCNKNLANKAANQLIKYKYNDYLVKPKLVEVINKEEVLLIKSDIQKFVEEFNLDISDWNLNPIIDE